MTRIHRPSPVPLLLCLLFLTFTPLVLADGDNHSPTCSHPLFTSPLSLLNHSLLSLNPTPLPSPTPSPCSNIPPGSPSCCSNSSYSQISSLISSLTSLPSTLSHRLPSLLFHSFFFHSPHLDLPPPSFLNLTATQSLLLIRYSNLITPLILASTPCIETLTTYIQGLLCLSCDPTWPTTFTSHSGSLRMEWPMCGHAGQNCQPMIEQVVAALPELIDLFTAFLVAYPHPLTPLASTTLSHALLMRALLSEVDAESICKSDIMGILTGEYSRWWSCETFICFGLLRGLDWDVWGWLNVPEGEEMIVHVPPMKGLAALLKPIPTTTSSRPGVHSHSRTPTMSLMNAAIRVDPPHHFHLLHSGLHGDDEMEGEEEEMEELMNPLKFPLVTMPGRPNGSVDGIGRLRGVEWGEDENFYPIWQVGCASLGMRDPPYECPAGEDRTATSQKWTFFAWIGGAAVLVGGLVAILWTMGAGVDPSSSQKRVEQSHKRKTARTGRFTLRKQSSQDVEAERGILQS